MLAIILPMRTLISTALIFSFFWVNAQEYLIDFRVKKLKYEQDSTVGDTQGLEILVDKTTEVINLGTVGKQEIGVQFEILKSELEGTSNYILAKVYYYRNSENTDWVRITKFSHSRIKVANINSREEAEQKRIERIKNAPNERIRKMYSQYNSDSSSDPIYFQIEYLLFVYQNE